ncbi:MAG: c-type cytochrome [Deltaproteobacteria bacterium]|nr:c-type cytochrome [Deltaproteobacteria bacterium]
MVKRVSCSRVVVVSLLTSAIIGFGAESSRADAAKGEGVFEAKKCGGLCHITQGPATEKTFADQLKKKGPELWYAGNKLKKEWMEKWLQNPAVIRSLEYNSLEKKNPGNHPKLGKDEAGAVTDYLMTLTSKDVETGVINPKSSLQGKIAFEKRQACQGCHQVEKTGKVVGGMVAPSLVKAGERLQGDWVYAYLKKPKVFKPVKRMPIYEGYLSDVDMKNIAALVASF